MEDFFYAGGLPALLVGARATQLDLAARTVCGEDARRGRSTAPRSTMPRSSARSTIPSRAPLGTAILRGNLAPGGAVMKPSAADPRLLRHAGPALVFRDYNDMAARIDRDDLEVTADHVLVLQNAGPVGGPGMPEWGMLPIPKKLLKEGVRDMVRISDARMSGTSYGACILHVAPEAYVGGPLAAVRNGDIISVDVEQPLARARGARERDRPPPRRMDAARAQLSARLQPPLRRSYPAGRQGLRLRFPRRHGADARAGDSLRARRILKA